MTRAPGRISPSLHPLFTATFITYLYNIPHANCAFRIDLYFSFYVVCFSILLFHVVVV